jgi:hypothetical protein
VDLDAEVRELRSLVQQLRVENGRLTGLLRLTPHETAAPGPSQTGIFDRAPGMVDLRSSPEAKVALFRQIFLARTEVYARRWENERTGKAGWMPAVRGSWRKGTPVAGQACLPLTAQVVTAHLSGQLDLGLYPLLDGNVCGWLAADFDGPAAMLDALAYLKAARSVSVPAVLEVSRSGLGAHVWIFFTEPVPAAVARQLGTGLIREAISLRGRMDLRSYDRGPGPRRVADQARPRLREPRLPRPSSPVARRRLRALEAEDVQFAASTGRPERSSRLSCPPDASRRS